jgi:hypothetical protein
VLALLVGAYTPFEVLAHAFHCLATIAKLRNFPPNHREATGAASFEVGLHKDRVK